MMYVLNKKYKASPERTDPQGKPKRTKTVIVLSLLFRFVDDLKTAFSFLKQVIS